MRQDVYLMGLVFLVLGALAGGCSGRLTPAVTPSAAEVASSSQPPAPPTLWHTPRQVMSYAAESFAPALSPAGKRLLFVSDRSGNFDIWLQELQDTKPTPAWQLTRHSATDTSPAWSPDGTRIAFTSHRSDPKGDILLMQLPRRAPSDTTDLKIERLTDIDTADSNPAWSSDGRFLVYTARQGLRRTENLWRLDLTNGSRQQLTQQGGNNAAFSPDGAYLAYTVPGTHTSHLWVMSWPAGKPVQLTTGNVLDSFCTWSRDGRSVFFTRYAEDTNRDGQVTIDDNPSIWRLDVSPQLLEAPARPIPGTIRLTTGRYYGISPTAGSELVYFATNRLEHLGIWAISPEGLIPPQESAAAQMTLAQHVKQQAPDDVPLQILALQRVRQHFPNADADLLAQAMYEVAVLYRHNGQLLDARTTLQALRSDFPQARLYAGLAATELVRLQADDVVSDPSVLLQQLARLITAYADQPRVQAATLLAQGDIAREQRQTVRALQAYDDVLTNYPALPEQRAEALYRKASIYALLQETENVLRTYLAVLQQFPTVRIWGTKAASDAIELLVGSLKGTAALARLRELVSRHSAIPILPAMAQRRLADLHRQRQERELATAAYKQVLQKFPQETEQVIAARFALAAMAAEAGRYQPALNIYTSLMQKYTDDADTVRQARQHYVALTLRKAERERQQRDPRLALHTYAQLIAFDPQHIAAYRGAVQLYAELGEIDQAVRRYRQTVRQSPRNAAVHYALGLAYTYTDPPRFDAAAGALLLARTLEAQSVFIHQTLGFVYEQQGRQRQDTALLEMAVSSYQTALSLNARSGNQQNRANVLLNLGNVFYALQNYTQSVQYYRQRDAMQFPFPHPTTALLFHKHFGIAAFKTGDLQESQQHLRQAIILATGADQPAPLVHRGANMSLVTGQSIVLQGGETRPNKPAMKLPYAVLAELWDRLGLSYQEDGKYEEAIEAFAQALARHRQQGDLQHAHLSLRNLANNRFFLAQTRGEELAPELLQRSLETYFASLESLQDYDPSAVQQRDATSGSLLSFETTLSLSADDSRAARGFSRQDEMKLIFTSIGHIYEELGDYSTARRYFRQKLALLPEEIGDAEKLPVLTEKALLLNQLGYFAYRQGDVQQALQDFDASLKVCRELQHAVCMVINQANIGRALAELTAAQPDAVSTRELQQALHGQEEALALLDTNPSLVRRLYPFMLRNNTGLLAYHLVQRLPRTATAADPNQVIRETLALWQQYYGYAQTALQSFRTALQQIATLPPESTNGNPARLAAVLQHNMAQLWRLLGQDDEAQAALQRALTLAESFYLDDLQWRIRLTLAELHPAGELITLQEAIRDLEKSPVALALAPYDHQVITLLDRLYGRMIELLIQQQAMEQAYIYAERWQAQQLLVHMGPAALDALPFSRDIDQALVTEARELVGQLRTIQKQLATPTRVAAILALPQAPVAAAAPRPIPSVATETEAQAEQELRTTYERTLSAYQRLLDEMQQERPELATLFTTSMVEPVEIQELLRPDSILIKYTLLPGQLIIWAIDQRNFHTRVVQAPTTQLTTILARLHAAQSNIHDADIQQLSTWLVEPIAAYLRRKTRLYILPDTHLLAIPWAALQQDTGSLIDRLQMSVVHSGHHLLQARSKRSLYHERLLVLETDQSDSQGQEPTWHQIAQAAASTVTLIQPGANTKARLLEQLPHHDLVHLNVPLVFNSVRPLQSSLRLSNGTQHARCPFRKSCANFNPSFPSWLEGDLPRQTGGVIAVRSTSRVEVREFYGMEASANLIILAQTPSDDAASILLPVLEQSLLFAGFAAVLVRHGNPDETYDRAFLTTFYRHLKQYSVGAALRQAQLALRYQRPQHDAWARFQLYGYQGMDSDAQQEFAHQYYRQILTEASAALQRQAWEQAATTLERAARLSMILQTYEALPVIYQRLTEAYRHLRQYDHAIAAQRRLLQFVQSQGTPAMEAEAHHTLGILYSDAEEFLLAVDHLQRAVALQQEHGLTQELTRSYVTLGIAQERGAAYREALQSFQRSLDLHQEIGSIEGVGEQLRRLGRIALLRLNNYAAAKDYFERALQIFTTAQNEPQIIRVLLELGRVYQQWGSFARALDYFQQAAARAPSQADQAVLAQIHIDLANTYWLRGDYQNAFNHQRQGVRLAQTANADLQRLLATNTLGLIYWTLNDPERARQQQQKAFQLARALELKHEEATVYNNTGIIDRQQKRYEDALRAFARALAIDVALKSRWGQAHAHRNLGMTYLHQEELDRAHTHLQKAVSLSRAIGDRTNTAKALLSLGDTALQKGDLATARQTYQETLRLARMIGLPEVEWRTLYGLGRIARGQGQAPQAIEHLRQAISVIEALRASIKVEEFRNGFINNKLDVYEAIIFLLLEQENTVEAFNYAERARARSFIDLLGNQRVSLESTVSRELFEAHQALKNRLHQLQQELLLAPPSRQAAVRQELTQQSRRYQELLIEIKSANPQLSSFVSVDPLTVAEVQQLLQPGVALVEYLVGKKQTVIWALTRERLAVQRVAIGHQELSRQVQDYRQRLRQLLPVEEESRRLYDLLLRPVESSLAAGSRYVGVIPHDILHYLPFASLHDGKRYFIDTYALFSAPSASSLRYTFAKRRTRPKNTKVLAVGNPDLGSLNYDLPLAEKEVRSLRWPFPETTVLTREKALESWVVQNIAQYSIVHIASHGEFDSVNPLFSSLKLARDLQADGNLEVSEIFGLDIQADLVTLSACQTGLGTILHGDELIGLNRAFIYAGTHAIISSLWRVDDLASAVLMKHFYRFYTRADKAESLRRAQLTVRRQFSHPLYWAGFVLSGDYD